MLYCQNVSKRQYIYITTRKENPIPQKGNPITHGGGGLGGGGAVVMVAGSWSWWW